LDAVNDTDWQSYLREISTNQSEIARAIGVHTATVSRWFAGSSRPDATQVIAVARAYDRSPVLALVTAGYLTRDEVEKDVTLTPGMSLAEFTELEIAQELVRRIEAGETTEISDSPLDEDSGAWTWEPSVRGGSEHEQRSNFPRSTPDYEALPHAALNQAREVEEDQHTP
jgi:transcriptional regulator with XRE-family HTH domain